MLSENFFSRIIVLTFISILFGSIITPGWAMSDDENNNNKKSLSVPHAYSSSNTEEEGSASSSKLMDLFLTEHRDILPNIFKYLPPKSLSRVASVSKLWNKLSNDVGLWKNFLKKMDFEISNHNLHPKLIVITALRASTLHLDEFFNTGLELTADNIDKFVALKYKFAIEMKYEGLACGKYGYPKDLEAARILNEELVNRRDPNAIERKLEGLAAGKYGYPKDLEAARRFNEELVTEGNPAAIERKFRWRRDDPEAARILNEKLVAQGNLAAIKIKLEGLVCGRYGYPKDPEAACQFNEKLVAEENPDAVKRKFEGLVYGVNGYPKDPEAARRFNEKFVNRRDPDAIKRKFEGFGLHKSHDDSYCDGGSRKVRAAWCFNEELVAEGNLEAIERKIKWFQKGRLRFLENPEEDEKLEAAIKKLNEELIRQGNPAAIKIKLWGIRYGIAESGRYGFDYGSYDCYGLDDSYVSSGINEKLVAEGNPGAIKIKLEGLRHGECGYKKDREAERCFNEELVAKGNFEAIKRKIRGLLYGEDGYPKDPIFLNNYIELLDD